MTIHNRLVRTDENVFLRVAEFGIGLCHIFSNIDHHGARAACACDLEGFLDGRRQIFHFGNQKLCFTHGREMPTISISWNASLPIMGEPTCPEITTSGIESLYAVAIPVIALVAPGRK